MLLDKVIKFFTSLRLTVVCLACGMVLIYLGTLAQVHLGLYKVQNDYFRSFIVWLGPQSGAWKVPFPGGYLVGGVLLINLVASHLTRFTLSRSKAGIWLVHFGLILLLLGQLMTDLLSQESTLHLREGEVKDYSVSDREVELAVIDTSDAKADKVFAVPQRLLTKSQEIEHAGLPFTIKVKDFYANSAVENRATNNAAAAAASQGIGPFVTVKERPRVTDTDHRDVPSAVLELVSSRGSLGTWVVSEYIDNPQPVTVQDHTYQLSLRQRRHYKPFSLKLLDFRHDVYAGTDIPKNFSSRVQLNRRGTGENRDVLIYMNNPLRYAGETFYQASFDPDNGGTVLQVVHNPSWLTPYLACVLVGVGLVVQFATHLLGFTFKRRTA